MDMLYIELLKYLYHLKWTQGNVLTWIMNSVYVLYMNPTLLQAQGRSQ